MEIRVFSTQPKEQKNKQNKNNLSQMKGKTASHIAFGICQKKKLNNRHGLKSLQDQCWIFPV